MSLPRMRGDPPWRYSWYANFWMSTPHARGSTLPLFALRPDLLVYPACAGIHLDGTPISVWHGGLPRMRGDPPSSSNANVNLGGSTPHARGSTAAGRVSDRQAHVYPACAGIHLPMRKEQGFVFGLPRMRGDPPSPG